MSGFYAEGRLYEPEAGNWKQKQQETHRALCLPREVPKDSEVYPVKHSLFFLFTWGAFNWAVQPD